MTDARENALLGLLKGELPSVVPYLRSFDDVVLEVLADLIEGYGPGGARLKLTAGGRKTQGSFSRARQYVTAMAALRLIEQGKPGDDSAGHAKGAATNRPAGDDNISGLDVEDLRRRLADEQGLEKFELIMEAIRGGNDGPLVEALTTLAKEVR